MSILAVENQQTCRNLRPPPFARGWMAMVFLFLCVLTAWADPKITAALDRDSTTVGEPVTFTLVFEDIPGDAPKNLPLPDTLMVQFAGRSSQISIVNGQRSDSTTYSYVLTPIKAGEIAIPALEFRSGKESYASNPLTLKVLPADTSSTNNATNVAPRMAFMRLIVPKNKVYVGEVLPVEVQLFFLNAQDIQPMQLKADGFIVGKNAQPTQSTTQVDRQPYNVVVFKSSVTATKAGDLTLGPAQCDAVLVVPRANQRQRNAFDDPFGFFTPRADLKSVKLSSETKPISVLPVPTQNAPTNFKGAVGVYSMTVTASPTNVTVGDPVTIKIRLTGRGSLDTLNLSGLDNWQQFKVYPPTARVESNDPLGIEGIKVFEFVATPQAPDIPALPPIEFSFWNAEKGAFESLRQAPIPLVIKPAGPTATIPAPPRETVSSDGSANAVPDDIINIKPHLGTPATCVPPLTDQFWFWLLQGIPAMGLAAVFIWRKRQEVYENSPRLRRQIKVEKLLKHSMATLRRHAEANEAEAFYALAFRLLQEQIGERLDRPASSITEAVVDEHLRSHGLPEEDLALLHDLFQRCNQVRYAPPTQSEGLFMQFPKVEAALEAIRRIPS